ncbi:VacJ family lipoprotein [Trinickia violacea]|uniref:VacJ family lipoprotein n=1 Tax=Trinickia violacea TaxID=2571746 RepID=A0A4P8IVP3_9BURK|nr:VacJ family lipoprotein [Trinickia violacea]QCP51204.1 VacJ family lipoprotein [Trinickia violacea]
MQTTCIRNAALTLAVAALAGCATVQTPTKGDPFEGFNRTVFKFNDTVDTYALKPAAQGYAWAVPQPVRTSVTNFFSNIGDVYIAANNLVQLKIADGVGDIMRVVINTVFGVGGLFDVATLAKLPKHTSDMGVTLGHYGVPPGPYLVLPLFGPSTARDAVGLVGDYFGNPLTYVEPSSVSWSLWGVNLINTRANLLQTGDVLSGAALDKYSFIRNAYLQRRQYLISDGNANAALPNYDQSLPNYGAEGAAAEAPASGAAAAQAASSAGAAAAAPAEAASAASGVEATPPATLGGPNGGAPQVPAQQFVPPSQGVPSLHLHLP